MKCTKYSPTKNVIKILVQGHGEGILLDSSVLLSYVADNLKDTNERLLKNIEWAVKEGVPQKLFHLRNADEHAKHLRINIILNELDEAGMKRDLAYELINYFSDSLGFKMQNPQPSSENTIRIGKHMIFSGRKWRVLDIQHNKVLLLSENIIEKKAYHATERKIAWAKCELRNYLNEVFYNRFFSHDKKRIAETRIVTNDNPWYGIKGGKASRDKIFLLSIEEVIQYFGDSGDLTTRKGWIWDNKNKKTIMKDGNGYIIKDKYDTMRIAADEANLAMWWWLRSPGYNGHAACISPFGRLYIGGVSNAYVKANFAGVFGVRPALWLKIENY